MSISILMLTAKEVPALNWTVSHETTKYINYCLRDDNFLEDGN